MLPANSELPLIPSCNIDILTSHTFFQQAHAKLVFVCWVNANWIGTHYKHVCCIFDPLSDDGIPKKYQALSKAFQMLVQESHIGLPPHQEYNLNAILVPVSLPKTVLSEHKKLECFTSLSKLSHHKFQ
jgi:hypothetical protein